MADLESTQNQASDHIKRLVKTALGQNSLSGLSEMLRSIAEAVNADGCILWELAPGSDLESDPQKGHFFILAGWFRDNWKPALHNLPLESIVGEVVTKQKTANVPELEGNPRVFMEHPVLRRTPVKTFCSVPISFSDNTKGAVNVYRNTASPLGEEEITRIEDFASFR